MWCILAEQVWLDFLGIEETDNRPMPFVDAVPVEMWIATPLPYNDLSDKTANVTTPSAGVPTHPRFTRHGRSASEVIPPKTVLHRKDFEPLSPPLKNRAGTTAAFLSASSSDPNLRMGPSSGVPNGMCVGGLSPVYQPHMNGPHTSDPSLSEPASSDDVFHNCGPHLPGAPFEGTSEDSSNGTTTKPNQDLEEGFKANVCILIRVPECANVLLDHFQFVFLMRLHEMLVKLQEDLVNIETVPGLSDSEQNSPREETSSAVFFSIVAQGINVSIVLPPAPDNDMSHLDSHASQGTSRNASSLSSYADTGMMSDGTCQSSDSVESKSVDGSRNEKIPLSVDSNPRKGPVIGASDLPYRCRSAQSVSQTSGRASAASASDSDGWLVVGGPNNKCGESSVASRPGSTTSNTSCHVESASCKDSTNKEAVKDINDSGLVSIFFIEGEAVDVGIHIRGLSQVIKVVCPELRIEELGVVKFEKYLNRKTFKKSLTKSTFPPLSETTPMVRLRAEFGPSTGTNRPSAGKRGFAHVKIHGLDGTLLVSSLESLNECFEDEVVEPPMPFIVEVENSSVSITNDNPPRLLSAPLAIPVDLTINDISVQRTHDGAFHVSPTRHDYQMQEDHSDPVAMAVAREESITASQLSLSDSASVSSRADSLESEKQCLVAQMSVSRAALQSLQDERVALLKTIERLQQELSFSNREQDMLQEKMVNYQRGGRRGHR